MATLTISTNQGWVRTDINGQAYDIVECTGASWYTRNTGDPQQEYPFRCRTSTVTVEVRNGTINGLFDQTMDWGTLYGQGNSAAVFLQNCPAGSSVKGWYIYHTWDAIRVVGVQNYLVEGNHIDGTRDDALEADQGNNGTIRRNLMEYCFTGISLGDANTPSSALNNTVLIEDNLVHMGLYFDDIRGTHASPLKAGANTPKLLIRNSVFAISRVDHSNLPRLETAFSKVEAASSGNYWLNLTDNALPSTYPIIPASFTYLQGRAARDHWAVARDAYLNGGVPAVPRAEVSNVLQINPYTGVIRVETVEAYFGAVKVGASNAYGSSMVSLTLTVA